MIAMSGNEAWAWSTLLERLLLGQEPHPDNMSPRAAQVRDLQSRPGAGMRYIAPTVEQCRAQIDDDEVPPRIQLLALAQNLGFELCGPEEGYPHLSSDETGNQWGVRAAFEGRACYICDPADGAAVGIVPDGWEWWIEDEDEDSDDE